MDDKLWLIRPIRPEEAAEARRLIYRVAAPLMEPEMTLEAVTAQWEEWGAFADLDDVQHNYFENGGVFLVVEAGGKLVGTGGFKQYAPAMCELRRIALLPEVQGRGLGYSLMMELVRLAREMGYTRLTLWTDRLKLARAVAFYRRLGFAEVAHEGADPDEIWMEMAI
jgi:N-acetylglutamate synthase-like GNAT family acetyltransferase